MEKTITPRTLLNNFAQSQTDVQQTVRSSRARSALLKIPPQRPPPPNSRRRSPRSSRSPTSHANSTLSKKMSPGKSPRQGSRSLMNNSLRKKATVQHFLNATSSNPTPRTMITNFIGEAPERTPHLSSNPHNRTVLSPDVLIPAADLDHTVKFDHIHDQTADATMPSFKKTVNLQKWASGKHKHQVPNVRAEDFTLEYLSEDDQSAVSDSNTKNRHLSRTVNDILDSISEDREDGRENKNPSPSPSVNKSIVNSQERILLPSPSPNRQQRITNASHVGRFDKSVSPNKTQSWGRQDLSIGTISGINMRSPISIAQTIEILKSTLPVEEENVAEDQEGEEDEEGDEMDINTDERVSLRVSTETWKDYRKTSQQSSQQQDDEVGTEEDEDEVKDEMDINTDERVSQRVSTETWKDQYKTSQHSSQLQDGEVGTEEEEDEVEDEMDLNKDERVSHRVSTETWKDHQKNSQQSSNSKMPVNFDLFTRNSQSIIVPRIDTDVVPTSDVEEMETEVVEESMITQIPEVSRLNISKKAAKKAAEKLKPIDLLSWLSKGKPALGPEVEKTVKPRNLQDTVRKPRTTKQSGKKAVRLPRNLTKDLFSRFCNLGIPKQTMDEVELVADQYWTHLTTDLSSIAQHAHRKTITQSDVELLMKRQGFITDKKSLHSLVREHLPLEYRSKIIPMATGYGKVIPD